MLQSLLNISNGNLISLLLCFHSFFSNKLNMARIMTKKMLNNCVSVALISIIERAIAIWSVLEQAHQLAYKKTVCSSMSAATSELETSCMKAQTSSENKNMDACRSKHKLAEITEQIGLRGCGSAWYMVPLTWWWWPEAFWACYASPMHTGTEEASCCRNNVWVWLPICHDSLDCGRHSSSN